MTGTNPTVSIRLNLDGAPQVEAGLKGAAGAAASLEKSTTGLGAATKLTGMQTAQMSAQLQDLFVQIQAGGSPLTALIQQGSQLSAVFGGFGPAFRAVASLITPTVVGLTAVGGAAAGLGAAFLIGANESKAFADSLALTGNAAGLTESRFNSMAGAIGTRTLSGVGTAREALQALVSSGRLSGDAIQATAGAVAALSRATGEGAGDIAKRFLSIVDNVGEGARKLNDQFNFLTAGQYAYIRSLEDAGRKQEAIAETMRLLDGRVGTTTQNLGYLESAWLGVSNAIGKAWDNLKGLGRTDTVSDQIKVLQAMADAPVRNGGNPLQAEARRAAIREQISLLREVERMENRGAEAAAARAAAAKAGIQWLDEGNKLLGRQAQYERDIAQARALAESAGVSPEDLAKRLDAIKDKYKDLGAAARKAAEDQKKLIADGVKLFGDLTAQSSGLSPDFDEKWRLLNAAQRAGAISVDQLTRAQAVLLQQQPLMVKAAADQERASAAVAKMYAEEADALEKLLRAQDEAATASLAGVLGRVKSLEDEAAAAGIAASANVSLGEAVEMLAVARLREAATVAAASGRQDQVNAINAEIEARQKLGRMLTSKEVAAAHQKAADEAVQVWQRASEQVGDAMYDALTGNYASAKRLIESQVIRPVFDIATAGIRTTLTNALTGGSGALQAGASGSNALGNVGALAGIGSSLGAFGTAAGFGFNALLGGTGLTALTGGASMAAAGSLASGLGMIAGVAGPIAIAAMALASLDKKSTPHVGGYVLVDAQGRVTDATAQQGGRQQADTQAAVATLAQSLLGTLNAGSKAFGGRGNNTVRAVFESDSNDPSWALFHLLNDKGVKLAGSVDALGTLSSDPAKGFEEFASMAATSVRDALLAIDLPQWASDALLKIQASDGADALAQTVADIVAVQEAITAFGQQFAGMGGMFERLAGLSSDATNELAAFSGGLDRLNGNLQGFFQAFYSDAERAAMTLGQVGEVLSGVGVALPDTRDQFRALVEAQDLATESGRATYAALLSVAGAFASVVPAAEEAAKAIESRLPAAIDAVIGKFQTDAEASAYRYSRVAQDLSAAGVLSDIPDLASVLTAATKQAVYDFAASFVSLQGASEEAKLAVLSAAGALADLKDEAAQQALATVAAQNDARAEAAAEIERSRALFEATIDDLSRGVMSAFSAVETAVESERSRLESETQRALDALERQADSARGTFDKLSDALSSLKDSLQQTIDDITGTIAGDGGRGQARAFLESELVAARAGKAIDTDAVRSAAGTLGRLDPSGFRTKADYLRDAAAGAQLLRDLSGAASSQIVTARQQMTAELAGIAEKMVGAEAERDRQLKLLDGQLDAAKAAAKSLVNIDGGVRSVAGAVASLGQAVAALAAAKAQGPATVAAKPGDSPTAAPNVAGTLPANAATQTTVTQTATISATVAAAMDAWQKTSSADVWASVGGAVATRPIGSNDPASVVITGKVSTFTGAQAIAWIKEMGAKGNIRAVYDAAKAEGIDMTSLDALMGWPAGTSATWAKQNGLPAFALGGLHEGGARLVGENGPEIAVTGPERIYSFDQLMQMAGGGGRDAALVEEVKALRQEVARMRAEASAERVAALDHASKTAALLKRWEGAGMPPVRV